jgi:two-component system response regulator MprA
MTEQRDTMETTDTAPGAWTPALEAATPAADTRRVVLIIDDDEGIRQAIRELLADEGYQVREASDGAQGLALLASARQRWVVLLDLMMPRVDGFEVCRRLEASPALRDQHAIVLMSARKHLNEANSPVVDATLAKPFDLDTLLATVDRLAKSRP